MKKNNLKRAQLANKHLTAFSRKLKGVNKETKQIMLDIFKLAYELGAANAKE